MWLVPVLSTSLSSAVNIVKMRWFTLVLSLLPLVSAAPKEKVPETFSQRVVFTPPSNYNDPRVLYARTAQFKDGTLLATWENYSPEPPLVYFPIYKSTDGGYSWKELSRVEDTANKLGTVESFPSQEMN